jgi:hypothetical protein
MVPEPLRSVITPHTDSVHLKVSHPFAWTKTSPKMLLVLRYEQAFAHDEKDDAAA